MVTITVSEKGGQQSTFEFSKPEITIGRMKGNDIVLPKGNVSKRHSRILITDAAFTIVDLGSTNGTYVNGRKITGEQPITLSDKIYIGDFILQVEQEAAGIGAPPPAPPAPPPGPGGAPMDLQPEPFQDIQPEPMDMGGPPNPGPPPAPPAPQIEPRSADVPRLESGWQPRPQEDVTVDRPADRMLSRVSGPSSVAGPSAILDSQELGSEFDPAFHAAQMDVARVLFETINPQELPYGYPPNPDDQNHFQQAVANAVGTVNPSVDRDRLTSVLVSECVGLGPLEAYLDDPSIRDIYVNRFDRVVIRREGALASAPHAYSHPALLTAAAYRLLGPRDVEVLTDEVRFGDGTKVHVVMPPLATEGPVITVRKPPTSHASLDELVQNGALSQGMAEFLSRAAMAGRSIVIAGPTSSGKSTLLSALTGELAGGTRVVSVEDHAHIQLPENAVRLEANPGMGYDSRYLVQAALAMHPQRIVVDECRGAEAYDWVTAAACGTEGSMATTHGSSAADALGRLESLCLLGSRDVTPRGIRDQIARAVNIVCVVNRSNEGFRLQQVTEVQGVDLDAFRLNDIFYYRVEGTGGAFHPTGYVPMFYEDLRNAGVEVDFGIFRE